MVYHKDIMPRKIAVVALNGFLGDRRGVLDVGELVNARAILAGVAHYTTRRGGPAHGGWNLISKRRIQRWIERRVKRKCKMVFVGKSYGAHWILDFYEKMRIGQHSHALLFDPAHTLSRGQNKLRTVPYGNTITVVRQLGFRSGYRVRNAKDIIVSARHQDIETRRASQVALNDFLTKQGL